MAQKIINVGTVANDGTGDTIRGAFTNVNANFTEVYSNIAIAIPAFATANAAFAETNSVNSLLQTAAVSANLYSTGVGAAGNAYMLSITTSGNAYTVTVGAASNTWANTFATDVGTAGNIYTSILAANNAVGANAWANAVGVASNNWSLSTFTTLSNSAVIFNTANAAFGKSNTAFQNTTGTFSGNLNISGTATSLGGFFDVIGAVREKATFVVNSNNDLVASRSVIIANNSNTIFLSIPDDSKFIQEANIGSTIEVYQRGTGSTKIIANNGVTILSSNNWANIAGQYLSVTAVKVQSNTWILTGNLKA